MLPPHLASLTFVDDALGSDEAIAARTASAYPAGRILVLGGSRPGLLLGLVERGCDVVVVDSSRTALRRTRDELGADSGVLLLADDPRELTVPGGADAALLTSAVWRAVLLPTDRRRVLHSIRGELRPAGGVLLEVERLPPVPSTGPEPVPGSAHAEWWQDPSDPPGTLRVRAGGDTVLFAAFTPADAVEDLRASGFDDVTLGDAGSDVRVAWIHARRGGTRG